MGGAEFQAKCLVERLAKSESNDVYYLARKIDSKYYPNSYTLIRLVKNRSFRKYGHFLDSIQLLKWLIKIKPNVIY